MSKMLPIGVSDFQELIEHKNPAGIGYAFVDKTLLIKEILYEGCKVILLPRPRRFGKTLNLSMLQCFLTPIVQGRSTKGLFANLAIEQHQDCMKYQGQYPVIFLTLKGAKYSNLEKLKQGLRTIIANLYLDFKYLLTSDSLEEEEKKFFNDMLKQKSNEPDLFNGLLYLSKFIAKHHDVKPYILIDEYDVPIQEAYINNYYEDAVYLMRAIFSAALKDNNNITKAILTGIVRVSKESLFSGLNNLMIYSILSDDAYSRYFGFLESEVSELLEDFNIRLEQQAIQAWYNGYQFGNNNNIYNPWSILNCIKKNGELQTYWVNTSSNALVKQQIEGANASAKDKLKTLIQGGEITEVITENFVYDDLGKGQIAMWSLLVLTGYLKVITATVSGQRYICRLTIPNKEVEDFYKITVEDWMSAKLGLDWFNGLLDDLTTGKISNFSGKLNKFLLESTSFFDTSSDKQEAFYHGLTLGLISGLKDNYIIKSNRESGLGRYDLMLIPHDKNRIGIIMEFKKSSSTGSSLDSLEETAEQALLQALSNEYQTELKQSGVAQFVAIGMAFSGKKVHIVSKNELTQNL